MLWKYKKCYQETTEDIVITPPEICNRVVTIRGIYTGAKGDPDTTDVEYILCGDETNTTIIDSIFVGMTPFEPYEELVLNECIKEGTLKVGGVPITSESPTGVPYWSIIVNFEECI